MVRSHFIHWSLFAALLVVPACTGTSTTSEDGVLTAQLGLDMLAGDTGVYVEANSSDCLLTGEPRTEMHKAMFDNLNAYRVANGLNPLQYSLRLEAAADAHVRDLYERDFFDHVNPDGDGPSERALAAGFCHQYVGENIAAGQPTEPRAMKAWQESPPHDENMLEPDFAYVGMGHYVDPTGRHYWGQVFAFQYP